MEYIVSGANGLVVELGNKPKIVELSGRTFNLSSLETALVFASQLEDATTYRVSSIDEALEIARIKMSEDRVARLHAIAADELQDDVTRDKALSLANQLQTRNQAHHNDNAIDYGTFEEISNTQSIPVTASVDAGAANQIVTSTAEIVTAFLGNNPLQQSDLQALIRDVYTSLSHLTLDIDQNREKPQPAVSPRRSITDDYLICLEDGKKFKSLKRHLRSKYDMSPQEYREKWGLPSDYPMVAPSYTRQRSKLAKQMGLSQAKKSTN